MVSVLEKVFAYLHRSLKIAWKTVFFNFAQYLTFFIAIMIIQVLYGMMTVSADNNNYVEYQHVVEEYDYHVVVKNLNQMQFNYIFDNGGAKFQNDIIFDTVKVNTYHNYMSGTDSYDAFLFMRDDADKSYAKFRQDYLGNLQALGDDGAIFSIATTPLLTFEKNILNNNIAFTFVSLLLLVVSIFLLTMLYRIRVNQYKFTYGIYLTFGADFKMLFGTAFWELFVIFVVTFIPSMGLSTLLSFIIYRVSGYGFTFNALALLKVALFTLVVMAASIWTPMKLMSVKDPMGLIVTEDNSNLVSSPRSSVNVFGENFPTKYELYSMWRFRKYNVQLLSTAIVFCALFIMGLYMSNIYHTDLNYPRPQFTVNMSNSGFTYTEETSKEIYSIEGVSAVEINDNQTEAGDLGTHMMVSVKDVKPLKNLVTYEGTEFFEQFGEQKNSMRISADVVYTAMPEEQLQILKDYEYSGDLSSVTQPGYVIVGDSISNVSTYKYEVGDTIWISVKTGQIRAVDSNLTGRILLKNQVQYYHFDYVPFTIGAVIYDIPCGSTPVFLNLADYKTVTGKTPKATSFNVYVDYDRSIEEVSQVYEGLRFWASYSGYPGDIAVVDLDTALTHAVDTDKHYTELFVVISILILIISPLVWFFSQTLYYKKREKEFNILQSIGAILSEIKQIYLQGGLVMAGMSLIVSICLSYLGSYILFYIYNVLMPLITKENVRYVFYMPWYALLIAIVMSVACGFLSTYIPFRSYYKYRRSLQNGGAGEEFSDEG